MRGSKSPHRWAIHLRHHKPIWRISRHGTQISAPLISAKRQFFYGHIKVTSPLERIKPFFFHGFTSEIPTSHGSFSEPWILLTHTSPTVPTPSTHPKFGQGAFGLGKQGVFDLLGEIARWNAWWGDGDYSTPRQNGNCRKVNSYPSIVVDYLFTFLKGYYNIYIYIYILYIYI